MKQLNNIETEQVNGGISFTDGVGLGGFAGGLGAAAAGASMAVIGSAVVAGGLIAGAGLGGYYFGNAIGLDKVGSFIGSRLYKRKL
ncbi:hypothetical protein ACFO4O_17510 [Glaciecola siphonariae]|uniref:Bacteriocin n=1 Tax=Glaciecola siphonariae TaxID=521012 RepID=A0ABV9LZD8_9ALTE